MTSKVALLRHKIPCACVTKVVWGRGYSRCPFEGHLSKSRPTCAVSHSNKREPGGWQMKTGINRISGREEAYQQCAVQKPEWFLFPAAPDEGFGQCGETSWNHSHGSSWECGNDIKINTLVFNNLLPSEAAEEPGRSWGSLDKAGQLGIPPYCSKWLQVWHRPCRVATVHTPSPPFTLQENWETLADKRISKSQAFSFFRSGKQYKVIVCILFKCLLCLLAFFFYFPFCWCRTILKLVLLHTC